MITDKDSEDPGLLGYMGPVTGLAGIVLNTPFKYPVETGHSAGLDRVETLVRYFHLELIGQTAEQLKLGFFKTRFPAACGDIARGTGAVAETDETDETDDGNTLLGTTASSQQKRNFL